MLVKKPSPYLLMAGQAPTISDNKIPANKSRVSQAAPCATHANILSARGLLRTALPGGGLIMFRLADLDTGSKAAPPAGNVEDIFRPWLFIQTTQSPTILWQ